MSIIPNLSSIWRKSENAYSGVIAQTLAVSSPFRTHFLRKLVEHVEHPDWDILQPIRDEIRAIIRDDVFPTDIGTEQSFGENGRTDICLTFEKLTLAIENKINADFQQDQLIRYDEYLRKHNDNYLLIFLAPSNYRVLAEHEKPPDKGRFAQLTYNTLWNWVDSYLKEKEDLSEFDRTYLRSVRDFLGEVDMPNIPSKEIDALRVYRDGDNATKKLTTIILGYKKIRDYPVYFGFRYGTDWYYAAPLIDNKCEVIVYVKDDERDKSIASPKNETIRQMEPALKNALTTELCKVDFYERKKNEECRLAIRRSLASFDDGNIEQIQKWLRETLTALEKQLSGK